MFLTLRFNNSVRARRSNKKKSELLPSYCIAFFPNRADTQKRETLMRTNKLRFLFQANSPKKKKPPRSRLSVRSTRRHCETTSRKLLCIFERWEEIFNFERFACAHSTALIHRARAPEIQSAKLQNTARACLKSRQLMDGYTGAVSGGL